MTIFDTFGKIVIFSCNRSFSCGFFHNTNLGGFSFRSILITPSQDLDFLFFNLPNFDEKIGHFFKILPLSPLSTFHSILREMVIFDTFGKIAISRLIGFLHGKNLG